MLCVSIKPSARGDVEGELAEAAAVGDIVELRVDGLPHGDLATIGLAVASSSKPVLLTLRSVAQGGDWSGSEEQTHAALETLAAAKPQYLDVEYDTSPACVAFLRQRYPDVALVASYHNLDGTPIELDSILDEMRGLPAAVYKIVTTARSSSDALRVLAFARRCGTGVIAMAMGERGALTRILGPWASNPWTYCALSQAKATAPGQLTASDLVETYNYRALGPDTALCGLVGDPVTYSVSQHTHNALFRALGIPAVYVKMHVPPEELTTFLPLAEALRFRGLSITIPHKEAVLPLLDAVDPVAAAIGAVNTLTFGHHGIHGRNTDADGALDAIEQYGAVEGKKVILIGAGGSARSVAYEARRRGARVSVFARRLDQAQALASALAVEGGDLATLPLLAERGYDILINTTPSEMPIREEVLLPGVLVMDLKPKPRETLLLQAAELRGCQCVYGIEMFVRQAIGQLQAWFGDTIDDPAALFEAFESVVPV